MSQTNTSSPFLPLPVSGTRASWLCVSLPKKLDEKQRKSVEQIRAGHLDLETAYQLGQAFVMMLAERRGEIWTPGSHKLNTAALPPFKKMANGIRLDYAAVKAAFSSEWSQGQVEAQVNCLKRKPRIVFGRANFDLTRAACPVPCVISLGAGMELVLWWQRARSMHLDSGPHPELYL